MKKISILLMLMALFAPLAMNAQQTATFNEGTSTSMYLPFYGSYADYGTKGQFIIPATDLADKGITSGSQISKLTFYSNATTSGTFFGSSRIVEVGEVSYSTFSTNANTFVTSGLTTVLSGTPNTLTRNADGTMEVSFSSNYTYNGGNLLISIGGYGSNYKSTSWYGVNTNNAGVYGNQSYSNSGSIPTTATMVSFAPKTTITYIPGSTPYLTLNPTSATVLTGFTETLTASYGNVTGTPTITYTSSDTNVATVTGNGTTATVTAIAEGTATITATMSYEGTDYPATCDITVMDACQPTWGSSPSYYITNLTVNKSGTTLLTNSSTGTAGTTTNYYATQSITAEPGDELSCVITMSSSSTYGFAMWVDFDQDGLDSGDLITSTSSYSSSPYTITLDIPTNASSGEYRMRICGDWSKQSFTDPCGAFSNGEAEDYKLIVNAGAYHVTCNATTNGTISVNHGSADAGETITITATPDTNYELTALSYNDGTDHSINFSNNQGSFTMPAADVTVSATFSIMRNLPPYDLTVGTPGGHSVELGWTGVSTNTNHQCYELYFSTDPVMPQTPVQSSFIGNITATSRELTGLTPETTYYAWVRDNCGTDGYSEWVAFDSFTTDVTCPAPTNVAANHVTNNSAVISWEGNADSYNVRYRPNTSSAIFFEGFEEGLPSTWTTIDSDGDGFNWGYHINTGTGDYTTHTGDGVAISASYDKNSGTALTPDNWLITPQLDLQGTMKVWLCGQDSDDYYEHFAIYLSTTGTEITDFTTTLIGETVTGNDMVEYTVDLSDYAGQQGYIAIRHFNCTDQFWLNVDDFGIYATEPWNTTTASESPATISGLTSETEYEVQVQANCGSEDGTSAWVGTTFTTLDDCAVPYELEVANPIAPTSTLTWTGAQDNYNVRYRTETFGEPQEYVFEEGFEGGSMPTGWTTTGSDWIITSGTGNSSYTGSATGNYNAGCYISSYSGSDILITPAIDLSQATSATLTFNFWNTSWGGDINTLNVYYRVDGGNWSNALYTNNSQVTPWTSISVTLPSSGFAANYQIGFECVSNYSYGMGIDDVKITYTAPSIIYGEWVNKPNVTSPLDITNLTPSTTYEWQVQGVNCDGNGNTTDWSALATFSTSAEKHFVTEGNWNEPNNWSPVGLPTTGEDVIIDAAATIPANYLANVGHVTLGTNGAITIADGGQLRHTNGFSDDVTVTLEKVINGYGTSTERDHYYFIAPAPFTRTIGPNDVTNMLTNNYDLYYFDAAAQDGLEWINQESSSNFKLRSAHGYLYANSDTVTLRSTGPAISSVSSASIQVNYHPEYDYYFNGWRLAGNPYVCNGYVYFADNDNQVVETDFYRMNENGDGYDMISSSDALAPFEGVFVYTENSGYISFSVDPIESRSGKLNMNLTRNGAKIDMARVRFGEGQNLSKISFREGSSEIYMPVDGKDYASIFNSERQGEVPVSFKAEKNGNYNLVFSSEEVIFSYLHLIDNMTGADVDLLASPSYTFEASTTDYESRFKLVFVTNDGTSTGSETFAFYSNGNWVISNDGNATLQVIDVNGRILKSQSINGCANLNINAAPGVYMLRLINGDNVKVQKVVVK